jgi:hypothetical protein
MKRLMATLLVLSAVGLLPAHGDSSTEVRYQISISGKPAGFATTKAVGENTSLYAYEFNDRGRGPQITSQVTVDAHGIPLRIDTTGHDYWKKPVDEHFLLDGGKATWSNSAEKGEHGGERHNVYLALESVPQQIEILARAALAGRGRVGLVPDGEVTIEKVADADAQGPGFRRPVHLYAITGLGFAPSYVWLDEKHTLFATTDGWTSVILDGWASAFPALSKVQDGAVLTRERALAKRLMVRPSGELVIRNARLFDSETGEVRPGMTVVVSGDRITRVARDADYSPPDSAAIIAARGRLLMPGLWDMHVHLTSDDGLLHIAAGVTTVRDMANDIDMLNELRRQWDAGETIGPRVLMAGFVDSPGPYAGPSKVLVSTEAEALAAVDRYAKLGYIQMKLYSSLDTKLVAPIIARAHELGMRVSGHIPNGLIAEDAVKLGFNEIQHANFLFLNFIPNVDTRTPERFLQVGEHAAELDLKSPQVVAFINLLRDRHVAIDPTLVTFEDILTARAKETVPSLTEVADRFSPTVRRGLVGGGVAPAGREDQYKKSFKAMLAMVKALYDAGVTIEAGTDALAGFDLHRELELYAAAGIPPAQILRLATLGAARVVGRDKDLGSIAPGKKADFILVEGDPLTNISDIRRVTLTVKDGAVLDPAELYKSIGVKPVS